MKKVNLKTRKTFNDLSNWGSDNKVYFIHPSGTITIGKYLGIMPQPKSTRDLFCFERSIDIFNSYFPIDVSDWKKNVIKRNGVYITPSKTTALEYSEKVKTKF